MSEYETTTKDQKTIYVHRLVWEENRGTIPKGMIIHHKNGEKKDNRIENLECVTEGEHKKHHWKKKKQM